MSCKHAEAGTPHASRPVTSDGQCATCNRTRKHARRRSQRLGAVRRAYGLSEADLNALVAAQRGRCWICQRRVGVVKAGAVDHDHALGDVRAAVRGLLCSTCNRWLGHIGDRPEAALRAAAYLIDPPARAVLAALDQGRTS